MQSGNGLVGGRVEFSTAVAKCVGTDETFTYSSVDARKMSQI